MRCIYCYSKGVTRLDILNYISHGISKIDPNEPLPDGIDDEELDGPLQRKKPLESFTVELVAKAGRGRDRPDRRPLGRDRTHDPGALPPQEK